MATDRTPGSDRLPPSPHDRVGRGRGPARGELQGKDEFRLGAVTARMTTAREGTNPWN
jgi:hypothetical protein